MAYDCFGAGQMVTQRFQPRINWMKTPKKSEDIFQVFLIVFQLHQMLWYLIEALSVVSDNNLSSDIEALILENEQMTSQSPNEMMVLDVDTYRLKVNKILKKVITRISIRPNNSGKGKDFLGKDFKKADLGGRDFSMSLMIAANLEGCRLRGANFLGADIRDMNIQNTDLRECVFLTQMQINSAKGNADTKLPVNLSHPISWQDIAHDGI